MKTFAAVITALFLTIGCTTAPGPSMQTQTATLPIKPTTLARTETPITSLFDDYPPVRTPPFLLTTDAQSYPPPGENRYTPDPTPTQQSPLGDAQWAWDSCTNADIPQEIADFQNIRLAGLVFSYDNNKWRIGADGRPVLINCLTSSGTSPGGVWEVFRLNDALWLVNLDTGVFQPIVSSQERFSSSPVWSPDEKFVYYAEANTEFEVADIWVWDVETGKSHPLTNTADVDEGPVSVWPAYPDWLLFLSRPRDIRNEPDAIGYLTLIRKDGSGEQRLTESPYPSFDFSPDGKTLAYNDFNHAWLLRAGEAPKPFLSEAFPIDNWKMKSLSRPNWSPDGTKIAWYATGENSTGEFSGAAVFDLIENKAWFVHPFVPIGMGHSSFFVEWDPTSVWLAMGVPDQDSSKHGIWVARYDSSEEYHNGLTTFGITWGPAGDQFLYKDASTKKYYLKRVGSWTSEEISLPYEVYALLWE